MDVLSKWFWGYGLRPLRVLAWEFILILAFAALYWTQLSVAKGGRKGVIRRLCNSIVFSARTSWTFTYGYEHSRTMTWQLITVAQSSLAKICLACFLYALSNTSPLLNDLVKRIVPGL